MKRHLLAFATYVIIITAFSYEHEFLTTEIGEKLDRETQLFVEYVGVALHSTALSTQDAVHDLEKVGWKSLHAEEIQKILADRLPSTLGTRHMLVFDENGIQRATSFGPPVKGLDVSDRPYFERLQAGEEALWYGPYVGRTTKFASYAYVKALHDRAGKFDGFVLGIVGSEQLNTLCAHSITSNLTRTVLVSSDNKIVAWCGVDSELASAKESKVGDIFQEFTSLNPQPVTLSDNRLITVKPVVNSGSLSVVSEVSIRNHRLAYVKHMLLDILAYLAALVFLLVPIRKSTNT